MSTFVMEKERYEKRRKEKKVIQAFYSLYFMHIVLLENFSCAYEIATFFMHLSAAGADVVLTVN